MEPIIKDLVEKRLSNVIYEIELIKRLFQLHDFDSILIMSEIGFTEQIIVNEAKKYGKEIILLQVGLHWDTPQAYRANNSQGAYPIDADKFFVWGEISKNDAMVCLKKLDTFLPSSSVYGLCNLKISNFFPISVLNGNCSKFILSLKTSKKDLFFPKTRFGYHYSSMALI